jgi:hypothetical protein
MCSMGSMGPKCIRAAAIVNCGLYPRMSPFDAQILLQAFYGI